MVIENGYWNLYLTLRCDYDKFKKIYKKESNISKIVMKDDGNVFELNKHLNDYYEDRYYTYMSAKEKTLGKNDDEIRSMYISNDLPEYYYDFYDDKDIYPFVIDQMVQSGKAFSRSIPEIFSGFGDSKFELYTLFPLKVYLNEVDFRYAPVYLYVTGNGFVGVKIEVPIDGIQLKDFKGNIDVLPFYEIKVCYRENEKLVYKIVKCMDDELGTELFMMSVVHGVVKTILQDSYVNTERSSSFNTIVITKTDKGYLTIEKILNNKSIFQEFMDSGILMGLSSNSNNKDIKRYIDTHSLSINGIEMIRGDLYHIIFFGDVERIMKSHNYKMDHDVGDSLFIKNSISMSFDAYIMIMLFNLDNQISLISILKENNKNYELHMAKYNLDKVYLEEILTDSPREGVRFYKHLEEIMNNHPVDYKGLINNIKMANDLRANKRAARLNDNIQIITILFTVVGGLPSIRNILRIIKKVFFIKADLIPNLTLDQMAIFLWILVILAVVIRIYKGNKL